MTNTALNELFLSNDMDWSVIMPMLTPIIFGINILLLAVLKPNLGRKFYIGFSSTALLISTILTTFIFMRSFDGMVLVDSIAALNLLILFMGSILFLLLWLNKFSANESKIAEFYALFLFMISGFGFMISTSNLILIFVALEISSLSLYAIIALKNEKKAVSAAIKYFTLGSISAGFFAFGVALIYLCTNTFDITQIQTAIINFDLSNNILFITALAFLLVSIGFKLSVVPFHSWVVEVYEAANAPLAGFISVIPKIAAFVVVIRLFNALLNSGVAWLGNTLIIILAISMSVANIMALMQKDIKRMLAFSSVAHASFILTLFTHQDNSSEILLVTYWSIFLFANLGAFAMLWITKHDQQTKIHDNCSDANNQCHMQHKTKDHSNYSTSFEKFSGLIKISPTYAIVMSIFLITLAGIPPFGIFWGKIGIIIDVINSGHIKLATIMLINSAIAICYYLKPIVYMFLHDAKYQDKNLITINSSLTIKYIIAIALFVCVFGFLFLDFIFRFVYILFLMW